MAREFDQPTSTRLEADQASISSGNTITISAWINTNSAALSFQGVFWIGDKDAGNQSYLVYLRGSDDTVRFESAGGGFVEAVTTTTFSTGTWHHVCGRNESATARSVFLDGGGKGTNTSSSSPINFDRTSIGRIGSSSPGSYFDGLIAEVAIWDVAISDAEVGYLAAGVRPIFIQPSSIKGYWPLIGSSSTANETDYSGQGVNLTQTNSPVVGDHAPVMPMFANPDYRHTVIPSAVTLNPDVETFDKQFILPGEYYRRRVSSY